MTPLRKQGGYLHPYVLRNNWIQHNMPPDTNQETFPHRAVAKAAMARRRASALSLLGRGLDDGTLTLIS